MNNDFFTDLNLAIDENSGELFAGYQIFYQNFFKDTPDLSWNFKTLLEL